MARREFLDARVSPIKPRHKLMLLILDEVARTDPFLWLGNAEAAARYGCGPRYAAMILGEMERAGLILRVLTTSVESGDERLGILLLRRADPNQPVIADEASKALAMQALVVRATSLPFAPREAPSAPPRAQGCSPPRRRSLRPPGRKDLPPN